MYRILIAAIPAALMAAQPAITQEPAVTTGHLVSMSELTGAPGGDRFGVLMEGLPVTVLESRGDWVRVRIEGWIPAAGVRAEASPSIAVAPAPAAPAVPGAMSRAALTGTIHVIDDGNTVVGRATAVRLVSDAPAVRTGVDAVRTDCERRRMEFSAEASRLKNAMGAAMRTDDTTAAFNRYDEARWARDKVLKDAAQHEVECRAHIQALFERGESARALSDDSGHFSFQNVEPGDYLLVAWFESESRRYQWEVAVSLHAGAQEIHLTEANLVRSESVADSR